MGKALYAGTGSQHCVYLQQFPVTISSNRPESLEMLINGLRCATRKSTYMARSVKSHWGRGIRLDLVRSLKTGSDAQVLRVSRWWGTTGRRLSVLVSGFISGVRGGSGGAGGSWEVDVKVVPLGPACCIRLTFHFISFLLYFSARYLNTRKTHSHVLLPFNSQLGIRKLERWGELHRENTSVTKRK